MVKPLSKSSTSEELAEAIVAYYEERGRHRDALSLSRVIRRTAERYHYDTVEIWVGLDDSKASLISGIAKMLRPMLYDFFVAQSLTPHWSRGTAVAAHKHHSPVSLSGNSSSLNGNSSLLQLMNAFRGASPYASEHNDEVLQLQRELAFYYKCKIPRDVFGVNLRDPYIVACVSHEILTEFDTFMQENEVILRKAGRSAPKK